MKTADRLAWLDGLKGFAILLVILGHVLSGYLDAGTFPEAYASLYAIRTWIYSFHMPLFFLISGFTFTLAYWREGTLSRSRYLRQLFNLFWIYVLFALLQWCVKQLVPALVNEAYDLSDLTHMLVIPLGNYWYLYVLILLYLLGGLTRVPKWNPWWLLLPAGLSVVMADAHMNWYNLTLYRVVYHFFFFAVGSALCNRRQLLQDPKLAGISAMMLGLAGYFYFFWSIRDWYPGWQVSIAMGISYVLLSAFYRFPALSQFPLFQISGRWCLELYLLHTFFTAGLRSLLPLAGITSPWTSVWVNFVLSTGASLGLASLAGKTVWADLIFRPVRFFDRWKRRHNRV